MRATWLAHLILLHLNIQYYLVKATNYGAAHDAVFTTLLSLHPS
jgi:hypothetical protein